jgi:hypothetical protein
MKAHCHERSSCSVTMTSHGLPWLRSRTRDPGSGWAANAPDRIRRAHPPVLLHARDDVGGQLVIGGYDAVIDRERE